MYNGIGLETSRGSGTNGFVQRNLSFIKRQKDRVDYKSEEEIKKIDCQLNREPNQEILAHERKRKIELKCLEMEELMEDQGYSAEEITKKVSAFRKMLMQKEETSNSSIELDDSGRPIAKATHQLAEANQARNNMLKMAFGIDDTYKDGFSFDPDRKAKEAALKNLAMAEKKNSNSEESEPKPHSKSSTDKHMDKKVEARDEHLNRKRVHHRDDPPSDDEGIVSKERKRHSKNEYGGVSKERKHRSKKQTQEEETVKRKEHKKEDRSKKCYHSSPDRKKRHKKHNH